MTHFVYVDSDTPLLLSPDLRYWVPYDDLFVLHAYDATTNGRVVLTNGFERGVYTIPYICPGVMIDTRNPQIRLVRTDGR